MLAKYTNQTAIILSATLLFLALTVRSDMDFRKDGRRNSKEFDDDNRPRLSDDEISYALSELSVDDLNALNQLMDALSEHEDRINGIGIEGPFSSEELARFKRENSDTPTEEDQDSSIPNVDEEYIRQLDDSFPNVVEQSNQDGKDKEHVRVKRK